MIQCHTAQVKGSSVKGGVNKAGTVAKGEAKNDKGLKDVCGIKSYLGCDQQHTGNERLNKQWYFVRLEETSQSKRGGHQLLRPGQSVF